jgi:hypothetical protein
VSRLNFLLEDADRASLRNVVHFRILILENSVFKQQKMDNIQPIYRNIILPVVLYGCETWSLTLKEEHKLRVFEKKVLGIIFGPRRCEVAGGWRKLRNEEFK